MLKAEQTLSFRFLNFPTTTTIITTTTTRRNNLAYVQPWPNKKKKRFSTMISIMIYTLILAIHGYYFDYTYTSRQDTTLLAIIIRTIILSPKKKKKKTKALITL